jgi:hypothetical protein
MHSIFIQSLRVACTLGRFLLPHPYKPRLSLSPGMAVTLSALQRLQVACLEHSSLPLTEHRRAPAKRSLMDCRFSRTFSRPHKPFH